ncbi:nucleoside-diphosphate sugar epimerase/dehydratase [Spirulina sp. CS-785/01]|uniref:polysaccharide biosynthesis protein n=1 Tax=Spirulina sp. CS-785/01 TaxID=3021716 RepID=UPI00232BAD74|nr:nucleoside-diphosphate sugar epimerase/dehydratase [Spirulina sp. CS-785/01]MDB9314779.1 nucleoside-diphosphate sugar epimerase/dehydratase [Spirulina sp. CS-785/01]
MMKRTFFPSVYRLGQLGLDGLVAAVACSLAFFIRFEGQIEPIYQDLALWLSLIAIPGRLITHTAFGVYQQVWRLFGLKDSITLLNAVTFYSLGVLVVTRLGMLHLQPGFKGVPLGVAVVDWAFCLMGMVAVRYARRRTIQQPLFRRQRRSRNPKRVLLVGAGMAGSLIVQEVRQNPYLNVEIVGFVDDDRTKLGRRVEGVKVLGPTSQLVSLAQQYYAREVLICMPSASAAQMRRIFDLTRGTPLQLKVLPGQGELIEERSLTPQVRELQIQDILGRPEIRLDFSEEFNSQFPSASEQVYQKTVLVTGAGGTIGSEICRQLARLQPQRLLLLGRGENSIFLVDRELRRTFPHLEVMPIIADIRHCDRMEQIFQQWRPDIIFHAAAHKHVPLMQQHPTEALENNALASAHLARLANRYGVKTFVAISTDKAVDPSNFMGLSKRLAELLIKAQTTASQTRFLVVRFGNVLGSRGSVVPIFQDQIARGGPVTVTDQRMTRYFMTTPEAAQLVIQSLAVGKSGQILILDMGSPVRIYDLARQMIELAGLQPDIDIPIQIMGLRPGEKLDEALVGSSETVGQTEHPKIVAVSSPPPAGETLAEVFQELSQAAKGEVSSDELWRLAQGCVQRLTTVADVSMRDRLS